MNEQQLPGEVDQTCIEIFKEAIKERPEEDVYNCLAQNRAEHEVLTEELKRRGLPVS